MSAKNPQLAAQANARPTTLGVIIGNRDFFPDVLVAEARKDLNKLFEPLGIRAVMLTPEQTKLGGVETYSDARQCADLFCYPTAEFFLQLGSRLSSLLQSYECRDRLAF